MVQVAAMKKIVTKKMVINKILQYFVLISISVIMIFPLITLIGTSLKDFVSVYKYANKLFVLPLAFENYAKVFQDFPAIRYIFNSAFLSSMQVIGTVITSSMGAFAFVRFRVKFQGQIFAVLMASLMIPGTVLQIPIYELYQQFDWIDTYWPFILGPFLGGGIINIFLIKQFMQGIPKDLFEAGEIDGANEFKIFFKILMPLCTAILITVSIFTFTNCWNDFFGPLLYLKSEEKFTLAYGLHLIFNTSIIGSQKQWHLIAASSLIMIAPIIIMYFFAQRFFVQGIALSGIKG